MFFILAIIFCTAWSAVSGDTTATTDKTPLWTPNGQDILKRDLLLNYDKFTRPAHHLNATNVTITLNIQHIDLEEKSAILSIYGWLAMNWNDEKLKWNPEKYENIKMLHIADHEVWQPDILIYNGASGSNIDHFGNTLCIVNHTGQVLWVPPTNFQVYCNMDLRMWPFDTQRCILRLGSWTYSGKEIALESGEVTFKELLVENHEWKIVDVLMKRNSKIYPCCPDSYIDIEYNIIMERRSPMYKAVVITPAIILILMVLANFWLPAQSGEKIILNCTNVVISIAFLIYFAQQLPVMALNTPLVVLFYSYTLVFVCLSMILSIVVINLSRNRQVTEMPWILKSFLKGGLGTALGLKHLSSQPIETAPRAEELRETPFEENNSVDAFMSQPTRSANQNDWIILATAIDRIGFITYCFVFTVLALVFLV